MLVSVQRRSIGLAGLLLAVWLTPVSAQQVSPLRTQQPPYYVGEPVVLQIVAKGFEGPEPKCRMVGSLPPGVSVQGPQASRSVSRFMQMELNGRTTTRETVNYTFQFVLSCTSPGEFDVGPFEIEHEGKTWNVEGKIYQFQELQDDADMTLSASIPQGALYIGQRVPVTVSWAMSGEFHEIEYAFRNLEIRSPLFDQFELVDVEPKTRTTLSIATAKGTMVADAEQAQVQRDGKNYLMLSCEVMLVPTVAGDFQDLPVTCRTQRGYRWRRPLLGSLQPSRTQPARATGTVRSFQVKPLPEGRPDSFAGAVGTGYGIDATANRTVVRVGDPISLTVSLRGPGLEKMSLPNLAVDGGLSPEQFQLPSEPPAGNYDGRVKQFKFNLRVKDESVDQIPALAYSYFDPEQENYVTARSKPIALQVMPAQILHANDVISAQPASAAQANNAKAANGEFRGNLAHGANLAIEREFVRLTSTATPVFSSSIFQASAYALGVGSLLVAGYVRRRGNVDSDVIARQASTRAWCRQIRDAAGLPRQQALQQTADALRKFIRIADGSTKADLNDVLRRCEEAIYAPDDQSVSTEVTREALSVAERCARGGAQ